MADQTPKLRIALSGSERKLVEGAHVVGPVDPNEHIEVSVHLRAMVGSNLAKDINKHIVHQQRSLSRKEYETDYAASTDDIAKVEQFACEYNLIVVETNVVRRVVVLGGTAEAISIAFGTQLQKYEHRRKTYRGRTGALYIPVELASIVTGVFGIDNRPQASRYIQYQTAASISYTPPQVAQLYGFPNRGNGAGQTIGIIELGGGYRNNDLTTYFGQLGISAPKIVSVSVDANRNAPTTPNSADSEVALDIEIAGSIAPGAKIVVYFAPNTDAGFLDAVMTAIHDTVNNPSVISISWGDAESGWTRQAIQHMNQAFQVAAALGITVCAAVGDSGSSDGVRDGLAHVSYPASDPYVLGCGGTSLEEPNGTITSEVVWNDNPSSSATGGGVSDVFGPPSWQAMANVPPSVNPGARIGRGVPDVAGNANPRTGYIVRIDGRLTVIGGTSAVAPLWAGLIALLNQQLGKSVGYLNPILYQLKPQTNAFHDITFGNNRSYSARQGWDACTGLGSPNGANLLAALLATGHFN